MGRRSSSELCTPYEFAAKVVETYGRAEVSRPEIMAVGENQNVAVPKAIFKCRVRHGTYDVSLANNDSVLEERSAPAVKEAEAAENIVTLAPVTIPEGAKFGAGMTGSDLILPNEKIPAVPEVDPSYVRWGIYFDVKNVIASKEFFSVYITGLSGNGKTLMVKQACAAAGREYIRVNITHETNEEDLFGGFRLIDGTTMYQKGPVLEAMERGAVLLLDEIDLGTDRIMCMQSVLEGEGYYVKKLGKHFNHEPGFTVIATGNTKGKGDDTNMFTGTNVLNEALLDRFATDMEQTYPVVATEEKILKAHAELNVFKSAYNDEIGEFCKTLSLWTNVIRKAFDEGAISEVISTRRNCVIIEGLKIFKDPIKAVTYGVTRFDDDNKESFVELFKKVSNGEEISSLEPDEFDELADELKEFDPETM